MSRRNLTPWNPPSGPVTDSRTVMRIGSMILNQWRPAAFTHERLDQNYSRHMRDDDNKLSVYQPNTDAYSTAGYVVRSPHRRTDDSKTSLLFLAREMYMKVLGKNHYDVYRIECVNTPDEILSMCCKGLQRLLINYGSMSSYSGDISLLSCLESMWTRIMEMQIELQEAETEISVSKDAKENQREQIVQLQRDLKETCEEMTILKNENKNHVKLTCSSMAYNGPELYKQCMALTDENKRLKLTLKIRDDKIDNPQEVGTNKALLAKCNRLQKENDRLEDIIAYLKTQVESGDFKQKPQPPRNKRPTSATTSRFSRERHFSPVPKIAWVEESKENRIIELEDEKERLSKEVQLFSEDATKSKQESKELSAKISELEDKVDRLKQQYRKNKEDDNSVLIYRLRLQHKEQTEAFQSDIKKQTVYVDSLTSEIDGLKTRIKELEHENNRLESEKNESHKRVETLERERSDLFFRNSKLKDEIRVATNELRQIKGDRDTNDVDALNKRIDKYEQERKRLVNENKISKEVTDTLLHEQNELQSRVTELEHKNRTLQREESDSRKMCKTLEKDNHELNTRMRELEHENKILQTAENESRSMCKQLQRDEKVLQARINDLEKQNSRLENEKKESLQRFERDMSALLGRLNQAEATNESLKQKARQDNTHLATLESEADVFKARISELEAIIAKTKLHQIKDDEEAKTSNELNKRIVHLEQERIQLVGESAEVKASGEVIKQERDTLLARIVHLEQERSRFVGEIEEFKASGEAVKQERDALLVRVSQLERHSSNMEKQTKESNDKREMFEKDYIKLKNRLTDVDNENTSLREKIKSNAVEYDNLVKADQGLTCRVREMEGNIQRLEIIKKDQRDKIKTLEQEKDSLLTRLSQYTSAQLVQDNPNVADLSDLNRPTKLAEKFSELYDNDWTDAFEILVDQIGFSEEQAIKRLLDILMVTYTYAMDTAEQQVNMLKRALVGLKVDSRSTSVVSSLKLDSVQLRTIQDLRKQTSQQSVESVKKGLPHHLKAENLGEPDPNLFLNFINKCAELCWYMALPSPPLFVAPMDSPGDKFDKNKYRFYQTSGKAYRFIVWPALYLHKDGNMLAKGIAEAM